MAPKRSKTARRLQGGREKITASAARRGAHHAPAMRLPAFRNETTLLAAILAATALIFSPALNYDFVYDDHDMIVHNRYLGQWSFFWKSMIHDSWWFRDPKHLPQGAFYRPLQDIWFAINFHLFGLNGAGWHTAMIALHLLVVWLVFRVAALLAGDRRTGIIAAALFAAMPPHAEAIVWLSAIPLPLGAAFELGAFEFFLRRAACPPADPHREKWFMVSMGLTVGALLSHEGAVTFPVLIAAHAFLFPAIADLTPRPFSPSGKGERNSESRPLPLGGGGSLRDAIAAAWPYAILAVAYLAVRIAVLGFITRPNPYTHLSALEVALTIPGAIADYVMVLAMPWRAGPAHPLRIVHSIASTGFYVPVLGLAALCAAGFLLLRRFPHRRLYLFCAAWFLITIAPMLNLGGLLAESAIQDRYLYLASFGFCLILADLAVSFAQGGASMSAGNVRSRANAAWIAAAVVAAGYAVGLLYVEHFWRDDVTLYSQCTAIDPNAEVWHQRLALALEAKNDYPDARRQLETAVKLAPGNGVDLYNLGMADNRLGNHVEGLREMSAGLALLKNKPPTIVIRLAAQLAFAADAAGDSSTAEAALKQAESVPGGAEAAAEIRAQLRRIHGD
ncbi:MAG: hypothetical protein ACREQI_09160 [Candidatus Binataceae bacterium]